jgi:hypothetical protein
MASLINNPNWDFTKSYEENTKKTTKPDLLSKVDKTGVEPAYSNVGVVENGTIKTTIVQGGSSGSTVTRYPSGGGSGGSAPRVVLTVDNGASVKDVIGAGNKIANITQTLQSEGKFSQESLAKRVGVEDPVSTLLRGKRYQELNKLKDEADSLQQQSTILEKRSSDFNSRYGGRELSQQEYNDALREQEALRIASAELNRRIREYEGNIKRDEQSKSISKSSLAQTMILDPRQSPKTILPGQKGYSDLGINNLPEQRKPSGEVSTVLRAEGSKGIPVKDTFGLSSISAGGAFEGDPLGATEFYFGRKRQEILSGNLPPIIKPLAVGGFDIVSGAFKIPVYGAVLGGAGISLAGKGIKGLQEGKGGYYLATIPASLIAGTPRVIFEAGKGTANLLLTRPFEFVGGIKGFNVIGKIGSLAVGRISTLGIPKVNLSVLKGKEGAFPTTKGGVKVLKKESLTGNIQKYFKDKFPDTFGKKDTLVVRTTTKTTTLKDVGKLAQYEEVAPFYSTKLSSIGLPQFTGVQQKIVTRLSLFKSGSPKGMIEVLKPKSFSYLPTAKTFKNITLKEYQKLSRFVGLDLKKLGSAVKGLGRIKVKSGDNIFLKEFQKVKIGKRPFKLREIDVLVGGRGQTLKAIGSVKAKPGVVYPTRAFQLGTNTEAEVVLFPTKGTELVRVGAKGLRQKYLGAGSSYAVEGSASAGIKFYEPVSKVALSKMSLLDKVAFKLEKARLIEQNRVLSYYARGEKVVYEPLLSVGRIGQSVVSRSVGVSDRVSYPLSVSRKTFVSREPVRSVSDVSSFSLSSLSKPVLRSDKVVRSVSVGRGSSGVSSVSSVVSRPSVVVSSVSQPSRVKLTPSVVSSVTKSRVTPLSVIYNVNLSKIVPVPSFIFRPKDIGSKISKSFQKGFSVFSRVGGKEVALAVNVPKNLALSIGKSFTGKTTARSFKIKEAGFTRQKDVALPSLFQYRSPKASGKVAREGFTFVEKSKYAIDTLSEASELKTARRAKKKKRK